MSIRDNQHGLTKDFDANNQRYKSVKGVSLTPKDVLIPGSMLEREIAHSTGNELVYKHPASAVPLMILKANGKIPIQLIDGNLGIVLVSSVELLIEFPANTPITVDAVMAGQTELSGDIPDSWGNTPTIFNTSSRIRVERNGVPQKKGVDVLWHSSNQIKFNIGLYTGETITIFT